MTSIKPPSSGPNGPHTLPDASDSVGRTGDAASGSFQASLDHAKATQGETPALSQTGSTGQVKGAGADPVAQLAEAVESGAVTLDQAVEQLLDHTLSRARKQLSAPQLAELSGLLRDALLSDPTLSALRSDSR